MYPVARISGYTNHDDDLDKSDDKVHHWRILARRLLLM